MRKIYIVLTKSTTILSKSIYVLTRAEYTHASICLDGSFENMYSFSRKYKHLLLPAGFVTESIYGGLMGDSNDMRCAVYELTISKLKYFRLKQMIDHMERNRNDYRFNILGLLTCMFNKKFERKYHFFCSQFVYHALSESGAIEGEIHPSLVRPIKLREIPEVKEVFKGNISQLRTLQITA